MHAYNLPRRFERLLEAVFVASPNSWVLIGSASWNEMLHHMAARLVLLTNLVFIATDKAESEASCPIHSMKLCFMRKM